MEHNYTRNQREHTAIQEKKWEHTSKQEISEDTPI